MLNFSISLQIFSEPPYDDIPDDPSSVSSSEVRKLCFNSHFMLIRNYMTLSRDNVNAFLGFWYQKRINREFHSSRIR